MGGASEGGGGRASALSICHAGEKHVYARSCYRGGVGGGVDLRSSRRAGSVWIRRWM